MNIPDPGIPDISNTPAVDIPLAFGPAQPVVLFPVRLETRFLGQPDGSVELRVRVYPDQIHMDLHEKPLTAEEVTWGKHFWEQTWRAADNDDRAKAAWRQLADRFDPPRAAWIARELRPENRDDRPKVSIAPDAPLPKPIRFPSPATKAEDWMRAPETRVLPNRWIVLGYKDGQLIVNAQGRTISERLQTGPDPSPTAKTDETGIDDGMRWIVNFDVAETAGMGIRVKLTKEVAAAGFDFLLVFGIRDTLEAKTDWRSHLSELFNAHHYTSGLGFVQQGTPTNNTKDAPSGFSSKDPGHEESYQAERALTTLQRGDGSNADVLTTALALWDVDQDAPNGPFASVPNAKLTEQLDARQMNTALWQATWGYFLLQMLGLGVAGENPLTEEDIAWGRKHFIKYVRGSGPLPALRVGKQPYGILPVTSLNGWKPQAGPEGEVRQALRFHGFVHRLRGLWRRNFKDVPRIGRNNDTAQGTGMDKDLAEVLSMDGLSSTYSLRHLMGQEYMERLWVFVVANYFVSQNTPREKRIPLAQEAFTEWFAKQRELAVKLLRLLEQPWQPRLSRAVFAPQILKLSGVLVQADQSRDLSPNYIQALLDARSLLQIRDHELQIPTPRTLLYLLLRHSMLLEYSRVESLVNPRMMGIKPREIEILNMFAATHQRTTWDRLDMPINQTGMTIGQALLGPTGEPQIAGEPGLEQLSDFRKSLTHLSKIPVAQLEKLLSGTLDLCSHRLDAWITSFATKRLEELRQKDPDGILFGGYGWVMNLKPTASEKKFVTLPGEQEPVIDLESNPGFIHAPSLTQASTAAVLRSGHLAHLEDQTPNDLLALNLSSERVRSAIWILDGVRQGQPLGAILGYRFERYLQGVRKAQYLLTFRELAPLGVDKLENTDQSVEAIAANNVVDGLNLLRRWQQGKKSTPASWTQGTIPFGEQVGKQEVELPPADPNNPDYVAITNALQVLEDAVDSVSDALIAESVYQVVRGNPLRAASTVDSVAGGETPPPELEFMRTPRTGIAFTHRLVTLFSGPPVLLPEWAPPPNPYRADAEPHLNAWVGRLLGSPAKVRCLVDRLDPDTGQVLETKEIRLDKLRLAPLDFVYAVEGGQGGQKAEIEQRILYRIVNQTDGFPVGSLLQVNPNRRPKWRADELSYGEFNELLRSVRKLVMGARGLDAEDLNLPERAAQFGVDLGELEERVVKAEKFLKNIRNDLRAQLSNQAANLQVLRELMLRAASFGVAGAVPLSVAGDTPTDRTTLLDQAGSTLRELVQRMDQLQLLAGGPTPEARRDHALERLRTVFGKEFIVLPRFTAVNQTELGQALANSTKLQDDDPFAVVTWFQRMARVRDAVTRLNHMLSYTEALGRTEKLKLTVAQLPFDANDRWVGLPLQVNKSLPSGRLSLVVQSPEPVNVNRPLAGLLIDEWVETVPNPTESTAITFQYDQPNAAPPQTVLIAVPPELDVPWTVWSMQRILLETLDLARIRAVDPDALDEIGHYLPALYFAYNTDNDTVSTDFSRIK